MVKFITSYATEYGLPMPAAPHGRDNHPPIYLPASETKLVVFNKYVEACNSYTPVRKSVGLTLFKSIWLSCLPHIRLMEPRSDVCHKCDNFRKLIMDSVTEEDKLEHTEAYNNHVRKSRQEREFYNACIKASAEELASLPEVPSGPQQPCSQEFNTHYTFDFAMSFTLPHQCLQVGPLYFLTTLKVHCFGICCEAAKKQVNFLFSEGDSIGTDGKKSHGPNNVLSMLHYYLCNFSLGEKNAVFHADNCGGQNKNKTLMHYFAWRVGTGLHREINYHFMEPGHTKCICDGCFGKVRQLFRRSDVDTTAQLSSVIERSAKINSSIMYRDTHEAEPNFQWYGWDTYFNAVFKPLVGIRKYHHFRFTHEDPGYVYVKVHVSDAEETRVCLLNRGFSWPPAIPAFPDRLPAAGFSQERLKYLRDQVRPFVREAFKANFCP